MSTDIEKVVDELHDTRRELRAAAGMIEELRDAVRSVRQLLDDASIDAAKTHLVGEPMASGYMRHVAQRMDQLAARCALTEAISTDLGSYLDHAGKRVEQAKQTLDTVDLTDAPRNDLQLASSTRARLDGIGDLLEMATPAAEAALGHLAAVKYIASQQVKADTSLASRVSVNQSIGAATDVLARTETRLHQLDDLVDHSDRSTRRSLHEADEVTRNVRHRLVDHPTAPTAQPAAGLSGPRR